jgi:hypothetical protein
MIFKNRAGLGVAIAILLVSLVSTASSAQGRGGMGGRRRGGDADQPSHHEDDQAKEWSGKFEDMASAKPVLKDVKLDKAAKDSIGRIEKTYKENFRGYANAAKRAFDDAKAQNQSPNPAQLDTLVQYARDLQDREYAEMRQLLPEDQRKRFDENVVQRRADDDKENADRRRNLGRAP